MLLPLDDVDGVACTNALAKTLFNVHASSQLEGVVGKTKNRALLRAFGSTDLFSQNGRCLAPHVSGAVKCTSRNAHDDV